MTTLTFYGGAGEIGGNKILLEDKGVKIYLDFGQSFNFGDEFFLDYLKPRTANGLEVYFEFGLVPKLPKLYSQTMLSRTDLAYKPSDIDAVFISHVHSDHVGHLPFLDESIPVYMGHGAHQLAEAYHKLYPGLFDVGEHKLHLFKSGDKIKVGHLIIEPIHVEHSVPGAYGFIVHTSSGVIVYTGDFRMHGPKSLFSREFIAKAASVKPKVLLIEGTRMGQDVEHNFTEEEVGKKALEVIKASKGVVFTYFSMMNIDRFLTFYEAAKKAGRVLVVDTKLAYILDMMKDKIALPDVLSDKHLRVYFRISKSCTYNEKDYYVYERPFLKNKITAEEVGAHPTKYVMHMGFFKLMELVYIRPLKADFIYSQSEHFLEGEENEEQREVLMNWMKHYGITFHKAHCSGHCSRKDLLETVKAINPEILVPVHTENGEGYREVHDDVRVVKRGETIEIGKKVGKRRRG